MIRFSPESLIPESWGRLEELSAASAILLTQSRLRPGDRIFLGFEIGGKPFSPLRASVITCARDMDGFCRAEIRFVDELEKRDLAAAILRVLSSLS
ncbi:MAG: hypothetical protein ACYCPQ_05165 [Elusimicrobiota bacterium]